MAVDQLNAAFDTYMEHEAVADARRVGRALRGLGVERRIVTHPRAKAGWDSLTDSELTVVNLIGAGRDQPLCRHPAAPFPQYGESPRPQCVRQAGHQLPRRIDSAHARVRLTSPSQTTLPVTSSAWRMIASRRRTSRGSCGSLMQVS
jgi:hypothetical protein